MATRIVQVNSPGRWAEARGLVEKYAAALSIDLSFQDFTKEIGDLALHYGPPDGAFFLAENPAGCVGCVGLRPFAGGDGELKRRGLFRTSTCLKRTRGANRMHTLPILNLRDVEFTNWGNGGRFEARLGALGTYLGSRKLGYRVVILPAGKIGWPFHFHHVNEEMFFILEGTGTLRYGDAAYPLTPGDVICCPPATQMGHQIMNTSQAELKYLAVSTMEVPEVAEYPDSGKFGVVAGSPPGADPAKRTFALWDFKSGGVNYWEGEK